VLALGPARLEDVFREIEQIGAAAGVEASARLLLHALRARVERVRLLAERAATRPHVAFLEWADPLFCGGHWNPELVRLAGGVDPIGREGEPSRRIAWDDVRAAQPDVLILSCCGYDEARARKDLPLLETLPGYRDLSAVRVGRVHVVNGSSYFSRPGPRLVDSLEMLFRLLHPELAE
jgi:iron complex transport system substrate-binding protein